MRNDLFAHVQQSGEVTGQSIGLDTHFRQNGAKRDRGAHRAQGVLRTHQQSGRWLPANALQSREDFNDNGLPLVERFLEEPFLLVERVEASLARVDFGLDVTHAAGGLDQLLIELAAIPTEHLDFAAQLGLRLCRITLSRHSRIELLIALLEGVGGNRRLAGCGRLRQCLRTGDGTSAKLGAKRQHEGQRRTEH